MARWGTRFLVAGILLMAYVFVDTRRTGDLEWFRILFSVAFWCLVLGGVLWVLVGMSRLVRRRKEGS